jgi:hypothetical protein
MTRMCNNVSLQNHSDRWTRVSVAVGAIVATILATMVLAASNSEQSSQTKAYRSHGFEFRALDRDPPWSGTFVRHPVLL